MLIAGETSGRALDDVVAEYGCTRDAYAALLRRFTDGGVRALLDARPRVDLRGRAHEVVRFIVTARLRDGARTPHDIAADLARLGHSITPRSVERTLLSFGLGRNRAPRF
jgi:hypothetical protein